MQRNTIKMQSCGNAPAAHTTCNSDDANIHAAVTCKGAQKPEIVSFIVSLSYKVSTIKEGVVFKEALSNL